LKERRLIIPILLCIDVEPDAQNIPLGTKPEWTNVLPAVSYLEEIRLKLQDATNSAVNFLWMLRIDQEIAETYGSATWLIEVYRDLFYDLAAKGDWIGLHPHTEVWDTTCNNWVLDLANPNKDAEEINKAFSLFNETLGFTPPAIHFRPYQMSNAILEVVEKWGCRYDVSLESNHFFEHCTGSTLLNPPETPQFPALPATPYQPSLENFWQSGENKRDLWIIPLSNSYLPHLDRPIQLNFFFQPANVGYLMDNVLEQLSSPYLIFSARTDIVITPEAKAFMDDTIDYIARHPLAKLFRFTNPAELVRVVKQEAKIYRSPVYLDWLQTRSQAKTQKLHDFERGYHSLETQHLAVKHDLEARTSYQSTLEDYVAKLEKELAAKDKSLEANLGARTSYQKTIENYVAKLEKEVEAKNKYIEEVERRYRELEKLIT
jgi:hypothetical protein